ncbi:MAG: hypothetical protein ACRYHQ_20925, partial [Janthinobacterium lividum]
MPDDSTRDDPTAVPGDATLALDRAHAAALAANGADLRHALEQARDLLRGPRPSAAERLDRALADLD